MKNLMNQGILLKVLGISLGFLSGYSAHAKVDPIEMTQKTAENQIRHLLEPLVDKYCHDQCKLMGVSVLVDIATHDSIAPGFDEVDKKAADLAPSSGRVKLLVDDKVGPVSRRKLLDLMQQYLDTLEYPVRIDQQIAHFPLPQGSEGKIAEMKERVSKQFLAKTDELLRQFCPYHCLLADYDLQTETVNAEEAQYGSSGEFIQEGDTALRIKNISATILMDDALSKEEQNNILEMARLKTNSFKHVNLVGKAFQFPRAITPRRGLASTGANFLGGDASASNSNNTSNSKENNSSNSNNSNSNQSNSSSNNQNIDNNTRQEKFERLEKIERVENGDAVQAELQKFKIFGLIFAASILALLVFIAMSIFRPDKGPAATVQRVFHNLTSDPAASNPQTVKAERSSQSESRVNLSQRYEIESLLEELTGIYAQQPRVAKQVFSRVLTEEGVEVTSQYIHLFGEGIVIDMLRDPSLQTDISELMEFYAKNPVEITDEQKLDLLRKLHNRTVAGKLFVLGNRSSNLFDFLAEMDGMQILELIRTESHTVKSIVLTQCDLQKRSAIYAQLDPDIRMKLLTELSRIDYLPKDYIFNVANALKRKRMENPKLNTEALPGSEVLVSLLERTGQDMQKTVVKTLEATNPDSARTVKSKLVSIDTLRFLRDSQLLEVVLSLKHDELIQFLKGTSQEVRNTIFAKSPKDLAVELEEELAQAGAISREVYLGTERKLLNRMKIMANEGQINLIETNERMFADAQDNSFVQGSPVSSKVAG